MEFSIPYKEISREEFAAAQAAHGAPSYRNVETVRGATLARLGACSFVGVSSHIYKFDEQIYWDDDILISFSLDPHACGWFIGYKHPTAPIVARRRTPTAITDFVSTVWTACPLELFPIIESYVLKEDVFSDHVIEYTTHRITPPGYVEVAIGDAWAKPGIDLTYVGRSEHGYSVSDMKWTHKLKRIVDRDAFDHQASRGGWTKESEYIIDADAFDYRTPDMLSLSAEQDGFLLRGNVLYATSNKRTALVATDVTSFQQYPHRKYLIARIAKEMGGGMSITTIVSVRPSDLYIAKVCYDYDEIM
jgi:hypothetical protein